MSSFTIEEKKNTTELGKYVWELKNKKSEFQIMWSITSDKSATLNKRNELLNKCRHANKFLLKNI